MYATRRLSGDTDGLDPGHGMIRLGSAFWPTMEIE